MVTGRDRVLRFSICLAAALSLGSCATLERARLAFKPDGGGEMTFLVRADSKGLPGGKMPGSLLAEVQECGFSGKQMERGHEVLVDAYLKFADSVAMARAVDCLPIDWSKREIGLTQETGLLYKYYTTTVWLEQPAVVNSSVLSEHFDRARAEQDKLDGVPPDQWPDEPIEWESSIPLLPIELSMVVPGGNLEVSNDSKVAGATLHSSVQANRANIVMKIDGEKRNAVLDPIVETLNASKEQAIPNDVYKVSITSREARYELSTLGTLGSLLGLLFGSGVLVQLFKWIRGRRKGANAAAGDAAGD